MIFGYARVSTLDQNTDAQMRDLKAAGCERIVSENGSGSNTNPGLARLLDRLQSGDTVVVWRLDRLGRSLPDLIDKVTDLTERGVKFRSLHESIDLGTANGKLMFHIFGALAEFERTLIRERTMAGLASARAKGKRGGRPCALSLEQKAHARSLIAGGAHTYTDVARLFSVDRATVYRAVRV